MRPLRHLIPCALALACMAAPSTAGAYVYWTTRDGDYPEADKVGRANLDGTGVDRALLGVSLGGIAVDAGHIYFTSQVPGGEGEGGGEPVDARADLDGGERIERITAGNEGGVQAVDGEHVYWLGPTGLGRAKLDLSDPEPGYLTGLDGIGVRFTVYGGFVYWPVEYLGVGCGIGRANLVTKVVEPEWIPECSAPGIEGPIGIAADSQGVFWDYLSADGQIGHASLLGGGVESDFIPGAKAFGGPIAIEGPDLFWASDEGIGHAHLEDGGSASVIDNQIIGFEEGVSGLAVNSASSPSPPGTEPPAAPAPPPPPTPGTGPVSTPASPSPKPTSPKTPALPRPKLKLDTDAGTATLTLAVPGPGRVVLSGSGIRSLRRTAKTAGPVMLTVRPAASSAKKLKRAGKAKVTAKIAFTPTGGPVQTESKALTLRVSG